MTDLEVVDGEVFRHERTTAGFPAAIGALPRVQVADFGEQQFDIVARYQSEDGNTEISVYVYRAGLPDVSLWFDRVVPTITGREGFEPASPEDVVVTPFVPPGQGEATALRMSYAPSPGSRIAGTAAALARYGDWLVKVRASSYVFNPAFMARLVDNVFSQMSLPETTGSAGLAYLVEPCATALEVTDAQQLALDSFEALPLAMLFGDIGEAVTEDGEAIEMEPVRYCRDSHSTGSYGVYRANEVTDGYVVAFSDAGTVISVGRGTALLDLLGASDGQVAVTLQSSARNQTYRPFDALPTPAAVIEVVNTQRPIAASDRAGNMQLFVDGDE